MNKPLLAGALCAMTVLAVMAKGKASDPVLMTVAGKDVPLSEFEYLYNKNNSQQIEPQSVDEYLDMFVTYKLKVADAEAAGIDTTKKFIDEFNGYRNELAAPYVVNKEFEDSLLRVAYDHTLSNVDVSHIMIPLADGSGNEAPQIALIDSIYNALVGGASFSALADKYSSDGSVKANHGHIGYVSAGVYPYEFEDVAYNTPEGEYSKPFTTRFGRHVILRGAERKAPGEVHVRHILRLTRGKSPEQAAVQKQYVDSLYNLLVAGADFAQLATANSEDPGSASKGGDLSWFGAGRMVPEFENASFTLADNEISKPFETSYGWHIVQRLGHRDVKSYDEAAPELRKQMQRDQRRILINEHRDARFRAQYPSKIDAKLRAGAEEVIRKHQALDSAACEEIRAIKGNLITTDGETATLADVIGSGSNTIANEADAIAALNRMIENKVSRMTLDAVLRHLPENNPDYRNLLGEYRDGMLLFEISNRNVWERASSDTEGLQKFFEANRTNYTWQKPHYKGQVVLATTDSVARLVENWLNTEGKTLAADSITQRLRSKFGSDARVERVVTARGDNAIVDYVAFNGPKPIDANKRSRWNAWFAWNGRVIDTPEEAADVKGAVTTDYQQQLEKDWLNTLHEKYPVKINRKILKKVK